MPINNVTASQDPIPVLNTTQAVGTDTDPNDQVYTENDILQTLSMEAVQLLTQAQSLDPLPSGSVPAPGHTRH